MPHQPMISIKPDHRCCIDCERDHDKMSIADAAKWPEPFLGDDLEECWPDDSELRRGGG